MVMNGNVAMEKRVVMATPSAASWEFFRSLAARATTMTAVGKAAP